MFFCSPQSDVESMTKEFAEDECVVWSVDTPCRSCLSGGNLTRLRQYEKLRREGLMVSLGAVAGEHGIPWAELSQHEKQVDAFLDNEVAIAHITQTAGQRGGRLSAALGTLIRNSLYWSFSARRTLTGSGALMAQGVPLFSQELGLPYVSCIDDVAKSLKHSEKRQLAGKMINAAVLAALATWVLGNYVHHEPDASAADEPDASAADEL